MSAALPNENPHPTGDDIDTVHLIRYQPPTTRKEFSPMKRFSIMLAALPALLLIPGAAAVHAVGVSGARVSPDIQHVAAAGANHVVKVADTDRDPQKWKWVPEQVTVKVGDTVTWDMTGAQVAHSATADDHSWDSGYINPGAKWTYTASKVGDIPYHCTPHPWKKGVIHVTP